MIGSTVRGRNAVTPRRGPERAPRPGRPSGRADPGARTGLPPWFADRAWPAAMAAAVGLLVLGFLVGVPAAFAHPIRVTAVDLPLGLPVALLAEGGVVGAAGVFTASRVGAALPALGWLGSAVVLATERAKGDVIIAADGIGIAYLVGGLVLFTLLIALPYDRIATRDRR